MNFLADESCAAPVIRALREAGHDVLAIAEIAAGASDEQVLEQSLREKRVLITEDLDFGNLVFGSRTFCSWRRPGSDFVRRRAEPNPPRLLKLCQDLVYDCEMPSSW